MGVGVCVGASGAGLGSSDMLVPPRLIRMSAREKTVMRSSPSNAMDRSHKLRTLDNFIVSRIVWKSKWVSNGNGGIRSQKPFGIFRKVPGRPRPLHGDSKIKESSGLSAPDSSVVMLPLASIIAIDHDHF